jgi:alcohol dehydrogenase class IV
VPTTAGTGAETESTAMLTHTGRRVKGCVWHPALKPACAVLDPELTVGLPSSLTAWTGCDALVHALEAWCVPCLHPICDAVALEALRLITLALPRVLDAPGDVAARGALLTGSCLAGVSFLKGLGLVHAISHMIGAEYDTHHGLTNAVLLPAVLRFNRLAIEDRIAPVAQAMGLADTGFNSFLSAVNALLDRCAIPHSLTDLGVREEDVPRLAEKAFADAATATNPRPASVAEIAALITAALEPVR